MIRTLNLAILILLTSSIYGQNSPIDVPTLLLENQKKLGLTDSDLISYDISDSYTTQQLGITHVYLTQKFMDIPVFNGILNLNVSGNKLLTFGNKWVPDLVAQAPNNTPSISVLSAIERSRVDLGHATTNPILLSVEKNALGQETTFLFEDRLLSRDDIPVELVWLSKNKKDVKLCWVVTIYELAEENIWNIFIDAHSGEFIEKHNQVIQCSFGFNQCNEKTTGQNHVSETSSLSMLSDSAYKVFPLTIESPNHGDRMTIVTPWHAAGTDSPATTLNWHDDGSTNYTKTRGNNVNAYEDIGANNSPGFSPDTANLQFDYPFDPFLPPADNVSAAITNLFYWNNVIHDIMYLYGFDEVSGNFQNDNLSRGGDDGDYVRAEGLDGGGLNNANFYTPSDGNRPRMQMTPINRNRIWNPSAPGQASSSRPETSGASTSGV